MSGDAPLGRCHFHRDGVRCQASVYWLKHERSGRMAPIDVEPDPGGGGNIRIDLKARTYAVLAGETLDSARYAGESVSLRLNHWVTCPAAQAAKAAR